MKKLKKNRMGFTLVELIVVIAILAILAGVAIPVYSGYISKANEAADLAQLDAIKTAAVFAFTEEKVKDGQDTTVKKITYKDGQNTVSVSGVSAAYFEAGLAIGNYAQPTNFKSNTFSGKTVDWTVNANGVGEWTPQS